jgi:hypothetical protein
MIVCAAAAFALESVVENLTSDKHKKALLINACRSAAFELIGHDNNKPFEVNRRALSKAINVLQDSKEPSDLELLTDIKNEAKSLGERGELILNISDDPYSPQGYTSAVKIMELNGIEAGEARRILDTNGNTGHGSQSKFLRIGQDGEFALEEMNLSGMIAHFCDNITHSPFELNQAHLLVTPAQRMALGDFDSRYSFLRQQGLAISDKGEIVKRSLADNAPSFVSHMDMQVALSEAIAKHILSSIGFPGHEDRSGMLVSLIQTKLTDLGAL